MPSYKTILPLSLETIEPLPDGLPVLVDLEALIDNNVRREGDCLLWTGQVNQQGFPTAHPVVGKTASLSPRRLQYTRHFGPIAGTLAVISSCENRRCLEPAHMTAGRQRSWTERNREERERNYKKRVEGEKED